MKNARLSMLPLAAAATLLACSHSSPRPETPPAQPQAPQAAANAAPSAAANEPIPALQLPADERPTHYALQLTIDPTKAGFEGTETVDVTLEKARQTLWINGRDLDVTQAWVEAGGRRVDARYQQVTPSGTARLDLPSELPAGPVKLHFAWSARFENRAVGLYKTIEANIPYAATQFEAVDARRAFPSFDQPGYKTPFDVSVIAPSDAVVVGNTPESASTPAANGMKQVTFQTTRPLPTYLVALAVGPWDVVEGPTLPPNAIRPNPLPTRGIAPKGRGPELAFALKTGAELVAAEEQYFQIPYPYPKLDEIALPDFAYGAMENAGAITYREQVLLYKEGVSSPTDRYEIASVMAHEIAHQWFGDLVTMPFWTDAWLNEGFATWMGHRTLEHWNPKIGPVREELLGAIHGAMAADSLPSARAVRQPLTHIEGVWNQFDGITYDKGAALLGMFERWVGDEKFREGIHRYLTSHAWGSGSTDDLLASISQAAGQNIAQPFHSFLDQPGIPLVTVKPTCGKDGASFELSQRQYAPLGVKPEGNRLWGIPVCIRYVTGGTERETCNLLAQQTQSVRVESCPDFVFPNSNAVGYYRWSLERPWLAKLEKKVDALSLPEKLDLTSNVAAAVSSGSISFADALQSVAPLAREPDPGLVEPTMGLLEAARDHLVPEAERVHVQSYGVAQFQPLWSRLGWAPRANESTATSMLRNRVLSFLTLAMHDPVLTAQAAKKGEAYAAMGQPSFHDAAVAPELAQTVLAAAVEQGGTQLFDGLLARLPTLADAELRSRTLAALTFTRDPKALQRALSLSTDTSLRANERVIPLYVGAMRPETREAAWTYLQKSFDPIAANIPPNFAGMLPQLFAGFCDEDHAAQLESFFTPKLAKYESMKLPLAHAVEQIRICAAVKKAQAQSATEFFQKHR